MTKQNLDIKDLENLLKCFSIYYDKAQQINPAVFNSLRKLVFIFPKEFIDELRNDSYYEFYINILTK